MNLWLRRGSGAEPQGQWNRKRIGLAGAALLLAAAFSGRAWADSNMMFGIGASVIDPNNYLVLDDAEDGDQINLLGGLWYCYDDADNSGVSQVNPKPFAVTLAAGQGAMGSDYYIRMTGTVTTTPTFLYPYFGFACGLNNQGAPMDLHAYGGIVFYAKGDGRQYKVMINSSSVTDYDYHEYVFTAAAGGWQEFKIPFPLFAQEGWGAPVSLDQALSTAQEIRFQTVGQPSVGSSWTVDLQLDAPTLLRVDDCEDGNIANRLGGYWYTTADAAGSTVTPYPFAMYHNPGAGAYGSDWMARMTGSVAANGYAVLGTGLNGAGTDVDLTPYYGIYLSVKGDGKTYRLNLKSSNITDTDYYGINISAPSAWQKILLPFSLFAQQGYGAVKTLAESLQHARDLQWTNWGSPHASVEISVDDYQDPGPVKFLAVSGRDIVDGAGRTVTVRGLGASNGVYNLKTVQELLSDNYYHLWDSDYAAMKNLGVTAVRFYLQYYWLKDAASRTLLFNYLDEQLRYARKYGIYLILNLHYFGLSTEAGWAEDGYYSGDQFGKGYDVPQAWDAISERYAHEPNIAAYDLLNEPQVRSGFTETNLYALYNTLVSAIRANGDNHIISIAQPLGVTYTAQPFQKLADGNCIYGFSFYEPHQFTHQAFYEDEQYELGAPYPFLQESGTYNSGVYTNSVWTGTSGVWAHYVGNWCSMDVAGNSLSVSLCSPNLNGQVWFDDVVLERQDWPAHNNLTVIPLKNANFGTPRNYVGNPPTASYLPAGWNFGSNWTPTDWDYFYSHKSEYYRLDTTEDHTGDGSGSLYVNGANVTWPTSGAWCKWSLDSGIMPSFFPETGYEYRISAWIKISTSNTLGRIALYSESYNYSAVMKDQAYLANAVNVYAAWGLANNAPVYCAEFGVTNPSQRDASFPDSPAYQVDWMNDVIPLLNSGVKYWTYHVYKSYNQRGDVFGLFDQGKEDITLQNILKTGF